MLPAHHPQTSPARSRVHLFATLAAVVAGLCLLFLALSLANNQSDDVREFNAAEFMVSGATLPPTANDPHWEALRLPDLWWHRRIVADSGWYRFNIPAWRIPERLQGIYLFRLHMNAAVYFNGELLGDGGRMAEPLARNWNRPLYFNVPQSLWRTGNNELLIHLRTYPGFGMIAPPQIADDDVLKPRYLWRQFLQNELSFAFTAALALIGLFTFGLWLKRRGDGQYLWFALSCFCWSIFNSSLYIRYAPISPELYQKLTHIALDFWMVFLVGFMHRTLGFSHPFRERILFAVQGMLAGIFLAFPMIVAYNTTHVAHAITLGLACYLTVLAWQRWRHRTDAESLTMSAALTALVLAGLHDWLMENPLPGLIPWGTLTAMWRHQFHLLFFMVPLLALFFAWHLTQRFIAALNSTERLNRELETRVAAAQQALALSYSELRVLEMNRAAESERERIYRDLHDDVGAKLLGLAIAAQRANQAHEADLARSALQDLRDVVSRSAHAVSRLDYLLADLRAETEQRVLAAGVMLDWRIPATEQALPVSPAAALNMSRILREAITNVLRHARASLIAIDLAWQEEKLTLTIQDDGVGLPASGAKSNRGMSSMRKRASALGGNIAWVALTPKGCKVIVEISLPHIAPDRGALAVAV